MTNQTNKATLTSAELQELRNTYDKLGEEIHRLFDRAKEMNLDRSQLARAADDCFVASYWAQEGDLERAIQIQEYSVRNLKHLIKSYDG